MSGTNDIELDDLRRKRELDDNQDNRKHGRLNLDTDEEQTIAYWAYGVTIL
jgi:hypothetical protein